MENYDLSNEEIIKMIRRLNHDNERDTVDAIRGNGSEWVALHKVHERNKIIDILVKKAKL